MFYVLVMEIFVMFILGKISMLIMLKLICNNKEIIRYSGLNIKEFYFFFI